MEGNQSDARRRDLCATIAVERVIRQELNAVLKSVLAGRPQRRSRGKRNSQESSAMKISWHNTIGIIVFLPLLLLTACCGEYFRGSKDVVSTTMSPSNPSIQTGQTQQFLTMGTFDGGSTADVTDQTIWTSSNPTIATIDQTGLATGVAAGKVTISGSCQCYVKKTNLTVNAQAALLKFAPRPSR